MMNLPAPRTIGAVPQTLAQHVAELPFGSQAQIRMESGQLAAFLAFVEYDRRLGTVTYALRVLNNTPFSAKARLFVEAGGVQLSAYPLALDVAPFSMRDDMIPVRMDITGPYDRAIVLIESDDRMLTVEASPPRRQPRRWWKWAVGVAASLVVLASATALCEPHVLDVTAPQKALAGSMLEVPYQVAGVGTVEYDLQTRDGLQLLAGLSNQSGVIKLAIPQDGFGSPYVLHVRMRNAFMKDEQTRTIAMVTPPRTKAAPSKSTAPAPALISQATVAPSPAEAGSPVTVHYTNNGATGDVWLVDADGTTWAHDQLSADGTTQLVVPKAAAGKDMRVVLHAQRAQQHAELSVGMTVVPVRDSAAPEDTGNTGNSVAPAQAAKAPSITPDMKLSSQVVAAGDTVDVSITGVRGDVRITMMDNAGTHVAEGDVDEGGALSLNVPNVSSPQTFFVVGTFTNGVAQQSVMKRLVVTPR